MNPLPGDTMRIMGMLEVLEDDPSPDIQSILTRVKAGTGISTEEASKLFAEYWEKTKDEESL